MAVSMETRNERIEKALRAGDPVAKVASRFDLSVTRIYKFAKSRGIRRGAKRTTRGKSLARVVAAMR